jgi:hypothetical protein
MIACNATISTMLHDRNGNLLNAGRRTRKRPTAAVPTCCCRDQSTGEQWMGSAGGGVPVAVKPNVIEPPGGMIRSLAAPVTVTAAPAWEKSTSQALLICWPSGHVQVSDQATGLVPTLVSVISNAKPPGQTLMTW